MLVEHEYQRKGTLAYLAAWDVHEARLYGRIEPRATIAAFDGLASEFMGREPYRSARRAFLVVDNGTIHRGQRAVERLRSQWPQLLLVHLPLHVSWLDQVEIYFSIVKRQVLTPNDFPSPEIAAARILAFQDYYQKIAKPFQWHFTRHDLDELLGRLAFPWAA